MTPMVPVDHDLLGWLAGRWSVDRAINGHASAFTGVADFTPAAAGALRWHEHGRLVLGAQDGPAYRTLSIARGPGAYEVCFDDGRPFHALDLATGRCEVVHHCGDDLYRGTYLAVSDDELHVRWHVSGPRKDDLIASVYRRATGAAR